MNVFRHQTLALKNCQYLFLKQKLSVETRSNANRINFAPCVLSILRQLQSYTPNRLA